MNNISVIGLDLAKTIFQVHGVDEQGEVVLQKQLKRSQVHKFFTNLQLVGAPAGEFKQPYPGDIIGIRDRLTSGSEQAIGPGNDY